MKVKIEKLIYEGWGMGRDQSNRPIFVKKSVPGDLLEVEVAKEKKTYSEAVIKRIIEPSPKRVDPACPYFNECGGCEHQNIGNDDQLQLKGEIFKETLDRAGVETEILPILKASEPFYYRNSIRFFLIQKPNGEKVFTRHNYLYEEGFVEAEKCLLQSEKSNEILKAIREVLNATDEKIGGLYQVKIREGKFTGEAMVELITDTDDLPFETDLKKALKQVPEIKSLYHTITYGRSLKNTRRRLLAGSPIIYEKIGKFTFQISPDSFFQTNSLGVKNLYDKIKEFAGIEMGDRVLDLYCGTGTIGIYLSTFAKSVMGVEVIQSAVNDAKANAKINNVANCEFICADAEKWLSHCHSRENGNPDSSYAKLDPRVKPEDDKIGFDKVIVDPPRAGLQKETIGSLYKLYKLLHFQLVYVSCNPATFARDIKEFEKLGLKLKKVQPLDMFPQTHHIECVGIL